MKKVQLGLSELHVTPICLGTMTFGEQVSESLSHEILDSSFEQGVNFLDTAELYAVPLRKETFQVTESIIGRWIAKNPSKRDKLVIATKVAGPSPSMTWIRGGSPNLTASDIISACEGSLKRLQIDVIDLYQIHWPTRNVPFFGATYFNPQADKAGLATILEQLEALGQLIKAGKVKAIGLSNETSYGVHEFIRLAERHNLPRIATVQNPYCLTNRVVENGLDETMYRLQVSLLAYSPLGFGLLTGKYDQSGLTGPGAPSEARMTKYPAMLNQRWAREKVVQVSKIYNDLARQNGMTPVQMALAFCYKKWQVASTIIGVTSLAQLQDNIEAMRIELSPDILREIDSLREIYRDPAI
jgi:aryl-alcohol dehydrogenase-like predicted oxidoreductase